MPDSEPQIPKGEIVWVYYANRQGEIMFALTSKHTRDYYFLYEVSPDGKCKKLGKAKEPPELEKKFGVHEKIRG